MRAINHALTGSLIGLVVGEPLVALPAAIASHYVCDALPHFGFNLPDSKELLTKTFRNLLFTDAVLCVALVAVLSIARPEHWLLACLCAFAAAAPDMLSYGRFRAVKQHRAWHDNAYTRFAHDIQWFERPIGAVVEVAWFVGAAVLLLPFLR